MSNRAWVTLATNDSYGLGALVLAHSLRQAGSQYPAVVLITPSVTDAMRERLRAVFAEVVIVDVLDSRDATHLALLQRPELGITFTKIHCWNLTQYEKCVFLDADTLVVQNCDELFEREELSAAPDVGWPDCFNSGVFVFSPSTETFTRLVAFAQERGSFDGGDQGLLNSFFSEWARGDINKHLPFLYNVTSAAFYSYLPALKHYGQNLKIIHFIGAAKPWLQHFNFESRTVDAPEHIKGLLQLWWDIFTSQVHTQLETSMVEVEEPPPETPPPTLPPQDVSKHHHYRPVLNPESEFPWHRPDAQIDKEIPENRIDMADVHDPWDIYRGHIPPHPDDSSMSHVAEPENRIEMRQYAWSYKHEEYNVVSTPQQEPQSHYEHWSPPTHHSTFLQSYDHQHQHDEHTINHNYQYHSESQWESHQYNQHISNQHPQPKQEHWYQGGQNQEHLHQAEQNCEHSHQNQPHSYDNHSFTDHQHEEKHEHDQHPNFSHHQYYHHHEHVENSNQSHVQNTHSDNNSNQTHVQNTHSNNNSNNYQPGYESYKSNEHNDHIQSKPENIFEHLEPPHKQSAEVRHVHVEPKRKKHRRSRRLKIDVVNETNGLVNGDVSDTDSEFLDEIIPRHPYDGFYLRHIATIDSRGRKICSHEIPLTPTPSPTPQDSPTMQDYATADENYPSDNEDQSGVAGNLARVIPGTTSHEALDELTRRQGWEAGNIDYMGADSFDKIWAKISQTLNQPRVSPPKEPSPPKQPEPQPAQSEAPEESVVLDVTKEAVPVEALPTAAPEPTPEKAKEPAQPPVSEQTTVSEQPPAPEPVKVETPVSDQPPALEPVKISPVSKQPSVSEPVNVETPVSAQPPTPEAVKVETPVGEPEKAPTPEQRPATQPVKVAEPVIVPTSVETVTAVAPIGETPVVAPEPVKVPEPVATEQPVSDKPKETPAAAPATEQPVDKLVVEPKKTETEQKPETPVTKQQEPVTEALQAPEKIQAAPASPAKAKEAPATTAAIPEATKAAAVTDSPPLANTPSKEEAPTVPAAKSEERRKPAGKLQLAAPAVADPQPTPDSELEDAATLAHAIIASELRTPTVTGAPDSPAAPLSPPASNEPRKLSVEEPQIPTPPVGAVSLAQIGVKSKEKTTTAAQIESSIAAVAAPATPPSAPAPASPATPSSPTTPAAPATPSSPTTPAAPATPSSPTTPAAPATPSSPTTPAGPATPSSPSAPAIPATPPALAADAPKKKVVKKVTKKESAAAATSGDVPAPVPPPRKKEKKPKEK